MKKRGLYAPSFSFQNGTIIRMIKIKLIFTFHYVSINLIIPNFFPCVNTFSLLFLTLPQDFLLQSLVFF